MDSIGANGIYRLYRLHVDDHTKPQMQLIGRFVIVGGVIHIMEDHGGVLEGMIPQGRLTDRILFRMQSLESSPYWRLVHEDDIALGHHPDLLTGA